MRNTLVFFGLLCAFELSAQTGINEMAPKASLHINKQTGADEVVGMLFPRLPASQLASVLDSDYDGVMVFVTEPAANPTGILREVTRRGYYFFDIQKNIWSQMGKRYANLIEEDQLIYAQVYRNGFFHLTYPGNSTNNSTYIDNYLTWNGINGTPGASALAIDADRSTIVLPKGHLFRVTALISIVSASRAGYVAAQFESRTPGANLAVSSLGYIETINEPYQEGGVAYPTAVVDTHNQAIRIALNAKVYGHTFRDRNLVIGGSESDDTYYYTQLIIEEL
ncbi:hypothetical protein [Flavobacterium sp. JP2137]|uniref:hypothetical protein n=1 Tax=Flavobacterium sp. JP2137 TaxID=3414510 RepID=UPI003D2FA1D6